MFAFLLKKTTKRRLKADNASFDINLFQNSNTLKVITIGDKPSLYLSSDELLTAQVLILIRLRASRSDPYISSTKQVIKSRVICARLSQ